MTENEAIEILTLSENMKKRLPYLQEVYEVAVIALEEIQQYHSIGTVEECREAAEKQRAKIPDVYGDGYSDGQLVYDMYTCPNCGENYEIDYDHYEYCPKCGQHMDKSDKVFE